MGKRRIVLCFHVHYVQICLNFWKIYYYISKFELNSRLDSNPSWIHYKICATILFQQYKFNHKKQKPEKSRNPLRSFVSTIRIPMLIGNLLKKMFQYKICLWNCERVRDRDSPRLPEHGVAWHTAYPAIRVATHRVATRPGCIPPFRILSNQSLNA